MTCWITGPFADRPSVAVSLWRHGQRQNQHRRAHPADLQRHDAGALRGGSGRPHRHPVRSGGASAMALERRDCSTLAGRSASGPALPWAASFSASMLELQLDESTHCLHRTLSDEGQQRHPDHRRFRTPDGDAARIAEPLGGAARPARGLSDAVLGHEVPGAVRADGGLLHQHEPAAIWPTKPSCAASRPRCWWTT